MGTQIQSEWQVIHSRQFPSKFLAAHHALSEDMHTASVHAMLQARNAGPKRLRAQAGASSQATDTGDTKVRVAQAPSRGSILWARSFA